MEHNWWKKRETNYKKLMHKTLQREKRKTIKNSNVDQLNGFNLIDFFRLGVVEMVKSKALKTLKKKK